MHWNEFVALGSLRYGDLAPKSKRGEKKIKLGEVNRPPTPSMAEKHSRMGLQQYATILQENNDFFLEQQK